MGMSCQIFIRQPPDGAFKAGRPVTGVVGYAVDEPTAYKDIVLGLVGKGYCTWTERKGKRTTRYRGSEVYTTQYISIYDKKSNPSFVLPIGRYEYQFTFVLPKDIPPTYEDGVCSIKYKIVLKFVKPQLFSITKKFRREIVVNSFVNPIIPDNPTTFGLEKTLFKPFTKKNHIINLKAEICNTLFSRGQFAELTYVVSNDTCILIPSVRTELVCRTIYTANNGRELKKYKTISECTVETPSVPENAVANMSNKIEVPHFVNSVQHSKIMVKEFKVKVTVRVPVPYINPSTEIPVVIGEVFIEDNNINVPMEQYYEEPPSYWEAMKQESKDGEDYTKTDDGDDD